MLLVLSACGSGPITHPQKLSSGDTIRVLSLQRMTFSKGPPAIVLRYETDLRLDDQEKLTAEVDKIAPDVLREAEKAGLSDAAIISCEKPSGWPIYHSRNYGFTWAKNAAGSWVRHEDK